MPRRSISQVFLGLALGLVPLAGCDVDVNDPGKLPDVQVTPGETPDVDVRGPDVDVKETEETITVPDVDVTIPEENENETPSEAGAE